MSKIYKNNKCLNCGEIYTGAGGKYCSQKCSILARQNNKTSSNSNSPILRMEIIKQIRDEGRYLSDIAKSININESIVADVVKSLKNSGYTIETQGSFVKLLDGIPVEKNSKIKHKFDVGIEHEFGVVSDTHLGSYNERLDVLEHAYDDFKNRKIETVFHAGNIVEGEANFNKYDIRVHGITDQTLYCIDHYPQREGITTNFITADDHEGWWFQREGIDFGRYLQLEASEHGRKDLIHLGYQEVDVELKSEKGSSIMRLVHPGGGSSYAISYALQKLAESYQGGEKPNVILSGHWHKSGVFYPREIHSVLCGCVCDQSRFMRKLKLQAHVGYYIIKIKQSDIGIITEFTATFKPFFDRNFYIKKSI